MALQIEQLSRDSAPQRIVFGGERTVVIVRPGDSFRFVDDSGGPAKLDRIQVRRLNNHMIIDDLPNGHVVELQNFFGACRPGAECKVELEGLGMPAGTVITEDTPPVAALSDGTFLLYTLSPSANAAAALPLVPLVESGGLSTGVLGAVGGGLLLVGAAGAAGGGGGGSGSGSGGGGGGTPTDTTPPPAPIVTSPAVLRGVRPVITGEAEAGARVTLRIDLNGNGAFTDVADVTFTTFADADGRWSIDTASAPLFGAMPPDGLAQATPYALLAQASDAAGNVSPATRTALTIDAAPPAAPVIDVIAGDDIVNAAERAQGVTVSGSAEAGSTVAVTLGGVAVTAVAAANGAWSVALTPQQLDGTGLVRVDAVATDTAGNSSPASSRQVVLETTVPGAPVITDDVAGTATGPVTFTITFERPVVGITASDFVVTGGTPGTFTAVSPTVYQLVVSPQPGVQSGQIVLQVPAGAGADAAGNPTAGPATAIQAYDTQRPSVTVTETVLGTANGPVTFAIAFSEAVTGFAADDVVVTGGTRGALVGSGTTYSLVVTPPAGAAGSISVNVPAGVAADAVGLTNTALAAPVVVPFDTAPPTLTITDNAPGTASGPVTFTFTFSEPVSDFAIDDLTITGVPPSAIGAITALNPSQYTLTISPAANTSGSIALSVRAGAALDVAGNPSPAATTSQPFNTDTTLPTLTITDGTAATVTNAPVTFTFNWSEPVTGFGAQPSDVVVTGGTVTTPLAGSGAVYTMTVTPTPGAAGTIRVEVPAGAAVDANGNLNATGASATQAVDTLAPVVTITDNVPGVASGPVTYTFAFGEAVTGFARDDITVTGVPDSAVGTLTAVNASTYTLVVTPPANSSGSIGVAVRAGAVTDAAGNPNAAATASAQSFNTDNTLPTLTITDDTLATVATGPVTFTFNWSEPVTGFGAQPSDVVVTGGTVTTPLAGSGAVYTMTVTPTPGAAGTIRVEVPAGAAIDANGNANAVGVSATQDFDTAAPTLLSIADNVPGVANGPITFTFNWSEPVTGFEIADIVRSGQGTGSFGPLTGSGSTYSLTYTPAANTGNTLQLSVGPGVVADLNGNPNTGTTTTSQVYDRIAPTVSITNNVPGSTTNQPVTFTFTTSEPVIGFTGDDVSFNGGTVTTPFAAAGGNTYTMTVTPLAGLVSTITVSVAADRFTDLAGNPNTAGALGSQSYDTQPPTQTVTMSSLFDNFPTGPETVVPHNGTTDDATPRLQLTLSAVLGSDESIVLSRTGPGGTAEVRTFTAGQPLSHQEPVALAPGAYSYSAVIRDAAGNALTLDLTPGIAGTTYAFTLI